MAKLIALEKVILKMCHHIYRQRPTCAELLSEYNYWGIEESQIKFNFAEQLDKVKCSKDKFFNDYLRTKFNTKSKESLQI